MTFLCVDRSASRVVHCWPSGLTYWRSSSQIGQCSGGFAVSANWVEQVTQMEAVPFVVMSVAASACRHRLGVG